MFMVVWAVVKGKQWMSHWALAAIEMTINVFIIADILLKMKLLGVRGFFHTCSNTVDFILMLLVLSLYAVWFLAIKTGHEQFQILLEEFLYMAWFGWQLKRIYSLYTHARTVNTRN